MTTYIVATYESAFDRFHTYVTTDRYSADFIFEFSASLAPTFVFEREPGAEALAPLHASPAKGAREEDIAAHESLARRAEWFAAHHCGLPDHAERVATHGRSARRVLDLSEVLA